MTSSFRVYRNQNFDGLQTSSQILPIMDSRKPPRDNLLGGISFDIYTKTVCFNDGMKWIPLKSEGVNSALGFSFSKGVDQLIPNGVWTLVDNWSDPLSPFHDDTQSWNRSQGVFTAIKDQTIIINVLISWKAQFNNFGKRITRIIYKSLNTPSSSCLENVSQPSSNISIPTTIVMNSRLKMVTGDQLWIEVFQDSSSGVAISGGTSTMISGFSL